MIRLSLAILLLSTTMVFAQDSFFAEGDFECLSDMDGPDTYHGTLRVGSGPSYGWLDPDTATVEETVPLQILGAGQVIFGNEFSEHIAPGSFYLMGLYNEELFAYQASLATDEQVVEVICTFVY
ncbi:hypothetical protein SAMN06295905_0287 [Devosia lucknowensis]|uniref:Uncharacterized protein n=1 Tax=Devosia lucknowensis TaxID=1096929 RepID=A0A1Y6EI25_9HYPH|nr:hypothetical protein [Devosia lucknowensis]SMQ59813.1 hypothetical protein SAMN06295905_0287 [Devosia lucknowensis]